MTRPPSLECEFAARSAGEAWAQAPEPYRRPRLGDERSRNVIDGQEDRKICRASADSRERPGEKSTSKPTMFHKIKEFTRVVPLFRRPSSGTWAPALRLALGAALSPHQSAAGGPR